MRMQFRGSGPVIAGDRTPNFDNIAPSPYEFDNWNIADWNRLAAEWRIPEPDATERRPPREDSRSGCQLSRPT